MYLVVHLVPFLLFKRKHVKRKYPLTLVSPKKEILKLLAGFVKSLLFAGGYTALVRRTVCFVSQHHKFVGCTFLFIIRFEHDSSYRGKRDSYLRASESSIIDSPVLPEQDHVGVLQDGQAPRVAGEGAGRRVLAASCGSGSHLL